MITKEEVTLKIQAKIADMKKQILAMTEREIKEDTAYIIHFKDCGQDFLEWHINKEGYVLDSKPFQRSIWAGSFTIPETAKVGGKLAIWLNGESYVNYPITRIEKFEVEEVEELHKFIGEAG